MAGQADWDGPMGGPDGGHMADLRPGSLRITSAGRADTTWANRVPSAGRAETRWAGRAGRGEPDRARSGRRGYSCSVTRYRTRELT
jgi:hypothetical protein